MGVTPDASHHVCDNRAVSNIPRVDLPLLQAKLRIWTLSYQLVCALSKSFGMESRTLQAFCECQSETDIPALNGCRTVRVLYTVNNNPQYILAKSSSQVLVTACNETPSKNEPVYAQAPLKACLAAVCDSRCVPIVVWPGGSSHPTVRNSSRTPLGTSPSMSSILWKYSPHLRV